MSRSGYAAGPHLPLGERARQAAELLIRSRAGALSALLPAAPPRAIYLAASRVVMRLCVLLFAEARHLSPPRPPDDRGDRGLAALFAPGSHASADPMERALAVLEDREGAPGDPVVREVLRLLCRGPADAQRGLRAGAEEAPLDFRELSPEQLGVFYEGLLDFELRRAEPGEWSISRWGGARKGSGAFYTCPELAGATVRRTLRPLAYDPPRGAGGEPDPGAPHDAWTPRRPEDILSLRVCDPAMGSGSFLIAALRFLAAALRESLRHHGVTGRTAEVELDPPRAGRLVLERCIHGVDIDPLAVELARAALWLEAMDPDLPIGLLRRRLKEGNALVGCWVDRARDYPVRAWMREGGDRDHVGGTHHREGARTEAIAAFRCALARKPSSAAPAGEGAPLGPPERGALDTWCALWFWPPERLDAAPTPGDFSRPSAEALAIVERLRAEHRFFHWELEFPDVFDIGRGSASAVPFSPPRGGFDAVVGNPPWEIQKPSSLEFFSSIDPLYRTYSRAEAARRQREIFAASEADERAWLDYNARFKALSSWVKHAGAPGGGTPPEAPPGGGERPFRHQGPSDVNTYKLFLEMSHALLRPGGALGMLVPSSLYSDLGTRALRELFVRHCRWRWLHGFANGAGIFPDVDSRFKVAAIGLEKGGETDVIAARFALGSPDLSTVAREIESGRPSEPLPAARLSRLSPGTLAFVEVTSARDLDLLERIQDAGVPLGHEGPGGWSLRYATELHMTADARLFAPRAEWESRGLRPDARGRWSSGDGRAALPLYEGRMIDAFDFSAKAWVSGRGRGARWSAIPWAEKRLAPQFLMDEAVFREAEREAGWPRIGFMDVSSATNERTMRAALLPAFPCGNKVPLLTSPRGGQGFLVANLNAFVYDFALRLRFGGLSLNWFLLADTPLVRPDAISREAMEAIERHVLRLAGPHPLFAPLWLRGPRRAPWRRLWAITGHERLRLRAMLDAIMAALYGLCEDDLRWILRDCDHPVRRTGERRSLPSSGALDPRGFWRVDRELHPELRHTVLSLAAFRDLSAVIAGRGGDRDEGIRAFCAQHDGDGWMLPEALRLADLGLGRDERAALEQPVRARLGERFLPWQTGQSLEESWAECESHAAALADRGG